MKSKRSLVIALSVVLFLAALLLGMNTVFSIARIEIAFAVSSPQAFTDSRILQRELEETYIGSNILFVRSEEIASRFDEYPYLTVKELKKSYPDKLILSVEEKTERYAISTEENGERIYCMIDANGGILRKSKENANNVDGGENFLIEGLNYSAENGFSDDENFAAVMRVCAITEELTGGIRTCFASMSVRSDATGTELVLFSKEGVTLYIGDPAQETDKKTEAAVRLYLSLEDGEKLYGYITVFDDINQPGEIAGPTYTPRS